MEMEQIADQAVNAHERPQGYQQVDGRGGSGSNYSVLNGEGSEASISIQETDPTTAQAVNGHQRPLVYQQIDGRGGSGSNNSVLNGEASEASICIQETDPTADQAVNAHQRPPVYQQVDGRRGSGSNNSLLNGVETSEAPFPIQETEPVVDQLVNGQQRQTLYQQQLEGGVAELNGLNYHTQLHASQRPDRPEYQPPYPEEGGDQASGCNCPVQETGQVAGQLPDEHEDLSPGHQQVDGAHINGVSSTGQMEQAMEHNCSRQELRLWNQELDRQASATSATFVWEITIIVIIGILFRFPDEGNN